MPSINKPCNAGPHDRTIFLGTINALEPNPACSRESTKKEEKVQHIHT